MRLVHSIGIVLYLAALGPLAPIALFDPKMEQWFAKSLFTVNA